MRISDVYLIIISRKDYFAAEGKSCLSPPSPLQIPGRASKNDIAFCVSLEKKILDLKITQLVFSIFLTAELD